MASGMESNLPGRPVILEKIRRLSEDWKRKLGEDHLCDLSLISNISDTAMTSDMEIRMMENGLAEYIRTRTKSDVF